ncbi:hypothetical protein BH09PLA1_BH09PLA1_20690 [soil metagenome]
MPSGSVTHPPPRGWIFESECTGVQASEPSLHIHRMRPQSDSKPIASRQMIGLLRTDSFRSKPSRCCAGSRCMNRPSSGAKCALDVPAPASKEMMKAVVASQVDRVMFHLLVHMLHSPCRAKQHVGVSLTLPLPSMLKVSLRSTTLNAWSRCSNCGSRSRLDVVALTAAHAIFGAVSRSSATCEH